MRMSKQLFQDLNKYILEVIEKVGGWDSIISKYETGMFFESDKVKDLQTRFMWDVYNLSQALYHFHTQVRAENLNDSHIETALRQICPRVTRKY